MKININGITREMTAEEEAEFLAEQENLPEPELSAEEKIAELEDALLELASLIGG